VGSGDRAREHLRSQPLRAPSQAPARTPTELTPLPPPGTRAAGLWGSPWPPRDRAPRGHSGGDAAAPARAVRVRRDTRASSTDPISRSPMVGRFSPRAGADSPWVMPETRCVSKNALPDRGV